MKNTQIEYSSSERTATVYPEMEGLLPALSVEEFSALEADILENGCYTPITVNEDMVIIDGHNRYRICQKHDIPFRMQVFHFDDLLEAKQWAFNTQQGRRNLGKWALAKIAMKLKPDFEAQAKANQGTRTDLFLNSEKGITPMNTTKELAETVGIGIDTMSKAIRIKNSGLKAVEDALDAGDISIHKGYEIVKKVKHLPECMRQEMAEAAVAAVKYGDDSAWSETGEYIPREFFDAVEQEEIKSDMSGIMTDALLKTPPEDRDDMAEKMIHAARNVYEKDRQIDEEHKIAKLYINGFRYGNPVKATVENVRRYLKFTSMEPEEMEMSMEEAYEIARNFNSIGDIIKNEFLPKGWTEKQLIVDAESEDDD